MLAIKNVRYSVPDALWIDEEAMVSLSFHVMNIGLWDVDPCESGCTLLDVMLYLSRDSKWEPALDIRIPLPGYFQEGNKKVVLVFTAPKAVVVLIGSWLLSSCPHFHFPFWPVSTLSTRVRKRVHEISQFERCQYSY